MIVMLPSLVGTDFVPSGIFNVMPFILMGLAMLCQFSALVDYKNILNLKNEIEEHKKVHKILKTEVLNKDAQISTQSKEIETLQKNFGKLQQDKESASNEAKTLTRSLQAAHSSLSQTENKLQASLEEVQKLKSQASNSDVLAFLSLLQEKGRLLDFLMDDITSYNDTQVGAAGRVVHQGCSKVLSEYFNIAPLHKSEEGARVTIEKDEPMLAYRVIGKHFEETPFHAKILHRGWGTDKMNIPRRSLAPVEMNGKKLISPVELEIG